MYYNPSNEEGLQMNDKCPKCGKEGLAWVKTKNQKNWLKQDLGDGQVGSEWHTCEKESDSGFLDTTAPDAATQSTLTGDTNQSMESPAQSVEEGSEG